ncbi:612_t:CDS:2 [Entrophospora sp. SA101]|nr:612_t:CDS:2 [Entrophospora sp. SA101]
MDTSNGKVSLSITNFVLRKGHVLYNPLYSKSMKKDSTVSLRFLNEQLSNKNNFDRTHIHIHEKIVSATYWLYFRVKNGMPSIIHEKSGLLIVPLTLRFNPNSGDSGIDIFGNYNHYLLLIQCKDFTNKIDVDYIRAFESIVARFDKDNTIRVYVILAKDGYAKGSVERVNSPEHARKSREVNTQDKK